MALWADCAERWRVTWACGLRLRRDLYPIPHSSPGQMSLVASRQQAGFVKTGLSHCLDSVVSVLERLVQDLNLGVSIWFLSSNVAKVRAKERCYAVVSSSGETSPA